jgi:hypothetical protein
MTLGELLTRLDAYANRTDPDYVDNRVHFIQAGHRWLERKFHGREAWFTRFQTSESVPVAVGAVPLPACYRHSAELRVYRLPDRIPLTRIAPAHLREPFLLDGLWKDLRDTRRLDTPLYYAVQGNSLQLRPLPAAALDLEIIGTGWADPLMADADESVLSQGVPDAVIYAALREVWLFMGDEPQMTYWEGQAARAMVEWVGDRVHEELPPPLVMEVFG